MYDPPDLVRRKLFNVLAQVGESDLIRLHTQEDVKVAKTQRPRCVCAACSPSAITGKKRTPIALSKGGQCTATELADVFGVAPLDGLPRRVSKRGSRRPGTAGTWLRCRAVTPGGEEPHSWRRRLSDTAGVSLVGRPKDRGRPKT